VYLVIRCPGCSTFTYVDRYQQHKLCHVCGEVIQVKGAPAYLEVRDFTDAEEVVAQLDRFLKKEGRADLSPTEIRMLRAKYAQWLLSEP
jgi:transcription initiation factor TFIIIB Brf1 subunit/transcription initiation factor TFIIB